MAKRAERAYRYELGLHDSSFIQFGYWDSLKKGLLAGERLTHDLKRMEVAYLEQNRREYETDQARLALAPADPIDSDRAARRPDAAKSTCPKRSSTWTIPGHYFRRIKSVASRIPCVIGPYTSVNLHADAC